MKNHTPTPRPLVQPIPHTELPAGASYGVTVDGVPVYKTPVGWHVCPVAGRRVWARVREELPIVEGERVLHGGWPSLNWTGEYTERQRAAYLVWQGRLIRAARKATAPERARRKALRASNPVTGSNWIRVRIGKEVTA